MNKQEQPQPKTSNVSRHLRLIIGGAMLLIGLLNFTASWIALYGQGSGAGFELFFLDIFVVFPLLVIGGLLLLRGRVRKTSSIVLLLSGGVIALIDYLVSSLSLTQVEYPYAGVGELLVFLVNLIGIPLFFIGSLLALEGLVRLAIQLAKKMFVVSKGPVQGRISRRRIIIALVGLVAVGGGIATCVFYNSHYLFTYHGHSLSVEAVAWSPDGKRIASGSLDGTVQVWDAMTGRTLYTYRGHSFGVSTVAWLPDGKYIASGSYDKTVQVWDAMTGTKLLTYTGHSDIVWSVAWSPDGKRIASGSDDYTVQVWNAP